MYSIAYNPVLNVLRGLTVSLLFLLNEFSNQKRSEKVNDYTKIASMSANSCSVN
jgi:hypothetical protein